MAGDISQTNEGTWDAIVRLDLAINMTMQLGRLSNTDRREVLSERITSWTIPRAEESKAPEPAQVPEQEGPPVE